MPAPEIQTSPVPIAFCTRKQSCPLCLCSNAN